ncbi:MAG: hypothetical protein ACOCRX_04650 [Candidatus Woesearchaeota archaeon]
MSEINKKILEEIVVHNKKVIEKYGNSESKAINEMITLKFEGHSIWNPFLDETGRFKVDPKEKYGIKKLSELISMYENR